MFQLLHILKEFFVQRFGDSFYNFTNYVTYILVILLCGLVSYIVCLIIPKKGKCCLGFLVFFGVFAYFFSQYIVEVNTYNIKMNLEKPVKVVQLSDFHYNTSFPFSLNDAIIKCNKEKPDIVVLTGDYKTGSNGDIFNDDFFKYIRHIHCEKIIGIYGNHDYTVNQKETTEKFRENGVFILENEIVKVKKNLYILGVKFGDDTGKQINDGLKKLPKNSSVIVLLHNPRHAFGHDYDEKYLKDKYVLFLGGHTHGGQVILPGMDKKKLAEKMFYIELLNGMTKYKNANVYISKGVGTNYVPLRFNAHPEICVFNLE